MARLWVVCLVMAACALVAPTHAKLKANKAKLLSALSGALHHKTGVSAGYSVSADEFPQDDGLYCELNNIDDDKDNCAEIESPLLVGNSQYCNCYNPIDVREGVSATTSTYKSLGTVQLDQCDGLHSFCEWIINPETTIVTFRSSGFYNLAAAENDYFRLFDQATLTTADIDENLRSLVKENKLKTWSSTNFEFRFRILLGQYTDFQVEHTRCMVPVKLGGYYVNPVAGRLAMISLAATNPSIPELQMRLEASKKDLHGCEGFLEGALEVRKVELAALKKLALNKNDCVRVGAGPCTETNEVKVPHKGVVGKKNAKPVAVDPFPNKLITAKNPNNCLKDTNCRNVKKLIRKINGHYSKIITREQQYVATARALVAKYTTMLASAMTAGDVARTADQDTRDAYFAFLDCMATAWTKITSSQIDKKANEYLQTFLKFQNVLSGFVDTQVAESPFFTIGDDDNVRANDWKAPGMTAVPKWELGTVPSLADVDALEVRYGDYITSVNGPGAVCESLKVWAMLPTSTVCTNAADHNAALELAKTFQTNLGSAINVHAVTWQVGGKDQGGQPVTMLDTDVDALLAGVTADTALVVVAVQDGVVTTAQDYSWLSEKMITKLGAKGFEVEESKRFFQDKKSAKAKPATGDLYQQLLVFANNAGKLSRVEFTEVFEGPESFSGGPCWPYEMGSMSASGNGGASLVRTVDGWGRPSPNWNIVYSSKEGARGFCNKYASDEEGFAHNGAAAITLSATVTLPPGAWKLSTDSAKKPILALKAAYSFISVKFPVYEMRRNMPKDAGGKPWIFGVPDRKGFSPEEQEANWQTRVANFAANPDRVAGAEYLPRVGRTLHRAEMYYDAITSYDKAIMVQPGVVAYTYMLGDFASSSHCRKVPVLAEKFYDLLKGGGAKNAQYMDPRDMLKAGATVQDDTWVPSSGVLNDVNAIATLVINKDELSTLLMASNSNEHVDPSRYGFGLSFQCSDNVPSFPKARTGTGRCEFEPDDSTSFYGVDNPGTSSWQGGMEGVLSGKFLGVRGEYEDNSVLRNFKEMKIEFPPPYNAARKPTTPAEPTGWAFAREGTPESSGVSPLVLSAPYWPPVGYANRIIAKCVVPRLIKRTVKDIRGEPVLTNGQPTYVPSPKPYSKPCPDTYHTLSGYLPISGVVSTYRKPLVLKAVTKMFPAVDLEMEQP